MKTEYPVIFTEADSVILIEVPDLEILTEGKNMENAAEMAKDAICLTVVTMEELGEAVPEPSNLDEIDVNSGTFAAKGNSTVAMVEVDTDAYMSELKFNSSLSDEEIDNNFKNVDVFSGIMDGLAEALECEKADAERKNKA